MINGGKVLHTTIINDSLVCSLQMKITCDVFLHDSSSVYVCETKQLMRHRSLTNKYAHACEHCMNERSKHNLPNEKKTAEQCSSSNLSEYTFQ